MGGGSLTANTGTTVGAFPYYNNGFNPHARGVYVIPDGVWNIGGITESIFNTNPFEFEVANTNTNQDYATIDFLQHISPEATAANQELGGYVFLGDAGNVGFTLSFGSENQVNIGSPSMISTQSIVTGLFHTHQNDHSLRFSDQDTNVLARTGLDAYLVNASGEVGKIGFLRDRQGKILTTDNNTVTLLVGYSGPVPPDTDSSSLNGVLVEGSLTTDLSSDLELDGDRDIFLENSSIPGGLLDGISKGLKGSNIGDVISGSSNIAPVVGAHDPDALAIGISIGRLDALNNETTLADKIPGLAIRSSRNSTIIFAWRRGYLSVKNTYIGIINSSTGAATGQHSPDDNDAHDTVAPGLPGHAATTGPPADGIENGNFGGNNGTTGAGHGSAADGGDADANGASGSGGLNGAGGTGGDPDGTGNW